MDYGWTSEPTEPENSHAPVCVSPLAVGNPSPVVTSAGRTLEEVPMYPVLPGSTEGSHNMSNVGPDMSSIRSGHNGPMQGFPVSVVDVEKGGKKKASRQAAKSSAQLTRRCGRSARHRENFVTGKVSHHGFTLFSCPDTHQRARRFGTRIRRLDKDAPADT
eukprot:646847-Rhodomonas_salina.4